MSKPKSSGYGDGSPKTAYKSFVGNEAGDGSGGDNEKAVRAASQRTQNANVNKVGAYSKSVDMPSKQMAKGQPYKN